MAWILGTRQLHTTYCSLCNHTVVSNHAELDCTFMDNFPELPAWTLTLVVYLQDSIMISKLVPPDGLLYITEFSCQHKIQPWPLRTADSVWWSQENNSQKILLQWYWFLLNHSWFYSSIQLISVLCLCVCGNVEDKHAESKSNDGVWACKVSEANKNFTGILY